MMKHRGTPEAPRGGPASAQRVLRIITILVAVVGLTYLGVAYYEHAFKGGPVAGEKTGEAAKAPVPEGATDAASLLADAADDDNETRLDLRYDPQTGRYEHVDVDASKGMPKTPGELDVLYGPILDGATINSGQLHRLLKRVTTALPADDPLMRDAPPVTIAALQRNPDKYREMAVTVRGKLRFVSRVPFAGEFPEVLEGQVLVAGQGVVRFEAARLTSPEVGREVVLHGLFMQLLTESAEGGGQVKTPLVVTSHPVRASVGDESPFPASTMVGVVAVLFVVYLVMMFWLRRRSQRRNPILEARRKVRGLVRRGPPADGDDGPTDDADTDERERDEDGPR